MRVLLIKLSSLGDVIHTLPALTDASRAVPGVSFDWVVEEAFAEIPHWHRAVNRVIPVALRRWRRDWRGSRAERRVFRTDLRTHSYDRVIDAQGLIKSALISRLAIGPRWGLDGASAREPLAAWIYRHRVSVSREQHAISRTRALFASVFDYPVPEDAVDYGIRHSSLPAPSMASGELLFLHGTTWPSKHWPESYWSELMALATAEKFHVLLPWGNEAERQRAKRIAASGKGYGVVLPRCGLGEIAALMVSAKIVIGVDTGLAHLSAALGIPSVTLYGATSSERTGTVGVKQVHLDANFSCAPCLSKMCQYQGPSAVMPACYTTLSPERVWQEARRLLESGAMETIHGA